MAIPFLVSIRFLCRACLSRLLGEFVWGATHSFRLFVFFFVREFLYELDCWSDVTVWKCNNALRHALQRDAMGGLHTFVGQQPEIFMAVEDGFLFDSRWFYGCGWERLPGEASATWEER